MATQSSINRIFKAIADPTRREIFHVLMLASASMTLSQISDHFDMSRQGVTKHVKLLEAAGLVHTTQEGRERFCQADARPLGELRSWLAFYDQFWDDKLMQLDQHLAAKKKSS